MRRRRAKKEEIGTGEKWTGLGEQREKGLYQTNDERNGSVCRGK